MRPFPSSRARKHRLFPPKIPDSHPFGSFLHKNNKPHSWSEVGFGLFPNIAVLNTLHNCSLLRTRARNAGVSPCGSWFYPFYRLVEYSHIFRTYDFEDIAYWIYPNKPLQYRLSPPVWWKILHFKRLSLIHLVHRVSIQEHAVWELGELVLLLSSLLTTFQQCHDFFPLGAKFLTSFNVPLQLYSLPMK